MARYGEPKQLLVANDQRNEDVVTGRIMTGRLGYYVRIEGAGPPVLLLHGFTGSHQSWDEAAKWLRQRYTVVRPDLPGHGASVVGKSQSWSMDTVAFSLFRMMRELGFPTFSVIGYSMGARVALTMAAKASARLDTLIVESGSPGLENPDERTSRAEADNALADHIEAVGLTAFVHEWSTMPLFATQQRLPEEVRKKQRNIRFSHSASGLCASLRHMGTGAQAPVWRELPEMRLPTLLITGQDDPKFQALARRMLSLLPSGEHQEVPDAGHDVHLEQPTAYLEIVLTFLDAHTDREEDSHFSTHGTMFGDDGEQ
ncbi:2-succinyl-6-hydroxy-2,4-cyclohexadiene-1-carboxylate synthase [Alicyclobacillus ferrooxydans]|uniref:2-succinyl-6-hydroxy-2, 4-cyclohexadiene-1-carboxylate synthase n=1 Tax=Alicyclobacillus ferrooxydans TaxID=471514 RepID=UPI0006D56C8D|nr:2-succinyl-6-hydroxy-2,4-cyclohexadiene-1-carboxylate synthase [Alicyclobacillus ferrooxydans]